MNVLIRDLIGPRCIVKEDGKRVYDLIVDSLRNHETVILDFIGVTQFASPFFNFAIGLLLKEITEQELRRLLVTKNLAHLGQALVENVIENSARYYQDPDYKKIVDEILEKQAKDSE
jgi:hypothetical protein